MSNAPEGASGWNPPQDGVRHFTLQSRTEALDRELFPVIAFILLVEDNPADAGLVRKALELHGVQGRIVVFSDGEKAIQFIEHLNAETTDCPDLAIVDLNLPKRSGREVLESMRHSVKCSKVPTIILSSSDALIDRADAARLGASRYIMKPTRLDAFLSVGAIFRKILESPR